jgi:hypothetical protein
VVPLTLAIAAVAGPIASLLIPANARTDCVRAEMVTTTTMLGVFAPQALLYRLSVVLAIPLVFVTRRICGPAAVRGVSHATLAGLAACAAGAAVGLAVSLAVPVHQKLEAVALAVPAAGYAILAFGVVAYLLDDGDLKSVLAWVRRVARQRLRPGCPTGWSPRIRAA